MPRELTELWSLFNPLYSDIDPGTHFATTKPLLAHYTTISSLERIISGGEVWLANPLYMNDIEEVRFGTNEGMNAFLQHTLIRDTLTKEDHETFQGGLIEAHRTFDTQHAFDTYILCLSEHPAGDEDGLLSMWRGYGDSGKGAAIIFDTSKLHEFPTSPLLVNKVTYGSQLERHRWFEERAVQFAKLVSDNAVTGPELRIAAHALFSRLRLFAIFTKDKGFSEEREWRVAYLPERDNQGLLRRHLGYHIGPRGVEPKLKMPVKTVPELGNQHVSLESLIHMVLLGPSLSSPLAVLSVKRMLELLGKKELADKVKASRIPYRPTPGV